jgi:hypothetical protein
VQDILTEVRYAEGLDTSGAFVPWPVDSTWEKFSSSRQGIGAGEERIATLVGAQGPEGSNSAGIDVIDPETGEKWEVKEPGERNEIRSAATGTLASHELKSEVESVVNVLKRIEALADEGKLDTLPSASEEVPRKKGQRQKPPISTGWAPIIKSIRAFNAEFAPGVKGGNIPAKMIMSERGLKNILMSLREYISTLQSSGEKTINMNGRDVVVPPSIYAKVAELLGLEDAGVNSVDILTSLCESVAFTSPIAWLRDVWYDGCKPSEVFKDVDGVILVNKRGYRVITRDKLDDVFTFTRLTASRPCFSVVGWDR